MLTEATLFIGNSVAIKSFTLMCFFTKIEGAFSNSNFLSSSSLMALNWEVAINRFSCWEFTELGSNFFSSLVDVRLY